jgi:tetratricopeptide (TPR) repeat protein
VPLLTASLIVRDESAFLGGCLASIAGIVDEIVVVDTGSIDGTPEIAAAFGARVEHRPWTDDFSAARNASLDLVTGEWVLYIDADERLTGVTRAGIEELLDGAEEAAFRILLRPRVGWTPYREYRLWRNDPRIRFDGVIHERVVPAIHRVAADDGRPIGQADLLLEHLGYEGDQIRKHHRNLPLLRRQVELDPSNLFVWHHLARVLDALGDQCAAEDALLQAIGAARTAGRVDPVACLSYVELIRLRTRTGAPCDDLVAEARALFPDNCVLLWIEARSLMDAGDHAGALEWLDQILAVDWSVQRDWGPSYDGVLVGELPWEAKALCHFRLGDYAAAADAYGAAATCAPDNRSYHVKGALARARATASKGV